jgi:phosphate transport system substrate-binding protein
MCRTDFGEKDASARMCSSGGSGPEKERRLFKHFMRVGVATGLIALSGVALTACGPPPQVLALVGSDTTQDIMGRLATEFNNNTSPDIAVNVPPVIGVGATFNVQGDNQAAAFSFSNPTAGDDPDPAGNNRDEPPNGSGAGITALINDGTGGNEAGQIDIARSSRGRSASDPANIDFFAFAKDAVSWARYGTACPGGDAGPSGCSPQTLTQNQLKGIYICSATTGVPSITNWNQVGGDNQPIVRYLPQVGSGTLSFFETKVLGLSSAQQGVSDDSDCNTAPIRVQENTGTGVSAANKPAAILPYSFAQWTAQSNGTVPDIRGGATLGKINNVAASATTINNGTFLGRRWVFNVVKQGSPSAASALKFVGVTSSANGYICADNSTVQNLISQYGFVSNPLGPAGSGLPNSRCRKNPAAL